MSRSNSYIVVEYYNSVKLINTGISIQHLVYVFDILHQQNLKNLFAFSGFSAAFPVADKRDKLTSWDPISWI